MGKSTFLKHESDKSAEFRKNQKLNELLSELTELLYPVQKKIEGNVAELKYPPLFVVGAPRSGTTLFTQWIASLGTHAYGSNFLTRFAYAPHIGALIQKMIFDDEYDFHGDFYDISSNVNLESNLGKSKGALAVNEFQHFFRNYMDNFDPEYLEKEDLKKVDFEGMLAGLASIEAVFNKPFCTKAFMLQYNIEHVWKVSKKIIFVHIERNPVFNMQSILLARRKYYGKSQIWLGPKPKEFSFLEKEDVYTQIAGQVYYTNKSINNALARIDENNRIHVPYEEFVNNPQKYFDQIVNKYQNLGCQLTKTLKTHNRFDSTNFYKLEKSETERLISAYKSFNK